MITFISNYLTPHQIPFCEAMYKFLDSSFHFISIEEVEIERLQMGWSSAHSTAYELKSHISLELHNKSQHAIGQSDIVIIGSAPDKMIEKRLRENKITFKYSERFYKNGMPLKRLLRDFVAAWVHHGRFQKYPLYMLCASAYTSYDVARFGNYRNKCYKWGYFPEKIKYDLDLLFKSKGSKVPLLLWAGRFIDWKHPDDAIRVAERLKLSGYQFILNLIGTGNMESQMRQMIAEKNLQDCVYLLGSMPPENVRRHMEQANIYLFTSDRQEGWGAVLNESMNSGCAVVASHAIGSVPFLMKDNKNGLIYRSGDIDILYEKVKYLLDNPSEQVRLGSAAYKTIIETWNAEVAAERFVKLAEHLLNGERSPDLFADGPCSKAEIITDDWM